MVSCKVYCTFRKWNTTNELAKRFIHLLCDLFSDLLYVDLFSQLVAHLREAFRPLTWLSAANCTAIQVEALLLLLRNREDVAEVGGPALPAGQRLQHRSGQDDSLSVTQVGSVKGCHKGW